MTLLAFRTKLLASFGVQVESTDGSSDETETEDLTSNSSCQIPDLLDHCKTILTSSNYNWFELQEVLEHELKCDAGTVLESVFFDCLRGFGLSQVQVDLVYQSKQAYMTAQSDAYESERTAQVLNGCIVTESESDAPEYMSDCVIPLVRLDDW